MLGYAGTGTIEFRVWWSRGRKLPTEGSFPACEIVVLAFVEDDHASVFVLKCYWDRKFILVLDTEVLHFIMVGQATF